MNINSPYTVVKTKTNKHFSKDDMQTNKHTKKCSISLIFREMQIITTVKYCFTSMAIIKKTNKQKKTIASVCNGVDKLECPYTADRNVKQCIHFGTKSGSSSKN